MRYQATAESLRQHALPSWFDDAKLGIFVHWGLYSVPGYEPIAENPNTMLAERGFDYFVRNMPYAEWYLHTLRNAHSPTRRFHEATYGAEATYDAFVPDFKQAAENWDPASWVELFRQAGARYAVLTTRHCESFPLWPTAHRNPLKGPDYVSERDLVGEFTTAVRQAGLRMGLYYCTGYDWVFQPQPMREMFDLLASIPQGQAYIDMIESQLVELIDRYRPDVLWGDVGYPANGKPLEIMAHYYDAVPDGAVNDRFYQPRIPQSAFGLAALRLAARLLLKLRPVQGLDALPQAAHSDFNTPEYTSPKATPDYKGECCRGLGHSFGYNRLDTAQTLLTATELVHLLVDVVSKNGNLLIGIGPMADGTVPEIQRQPLLGLGAWLAVNGEAIYGTCPWQIAAGTTGEGLAVRYTRKDNVLYAIMLGQPQGTVTLAGLTPYVAGDVQLLGSDGALTVRQDGEELHVALPADLPLAAAHVLRLGLRRT